MDGALRRHRVHLPTLGGFKVWHELHTQFLVNMSPRLKDPAAVALRGPGEDGHCAAKCPRLPQVQQGLARRAELSRHGAELKDFTSEEAVFAPRARARLFFTIRTTSSPAVPFRNCSATRSSMMPSARACSPIGIRFRRETSAHDGRGGGAMPTRGQKGSAAPPGEEKKSTRHQQGQNPLLTRAEDGALATEVQVCLAGPCHSEGARHKHS